MGRTKKRRRPHLGRLGAALVLLAGMPCPLAFAQPVEASDTTTTIRGITVSTHRSGQEWASDQIGPTFDDVRAVGANWVAVHPYARISADGTVRFRPIDRSSPPAEIVRPIREAQARGLQIFVKPHLAYWGSPFSWRGEITFSDDESWQRFFTSYGEWIEGVASVTYEADGFAVGTELDLTVGYEREWREVISRVRRVSGSALTYAANWTHYREVPFWDALDAVGIQAYFPISMSERPSDADIEAGWSALMGELRAFRSVTAKPIVFTELGYNRSWSAAREPWDNHTDGPDAEGLQRRLLGVALDAIEREEAVVGAFLWKWFPRPRSVGRDFQLAAPAIQDTLRRSWVGSSGGDR